MFIFKNLRNDFMKLKKIKTTISMFWYFADCLLLLVKIDTAKLEVIMTNYSQSITKNSFCDD